MTAMTQPAPEWAVRALSGVYDPCCREKGISVVDMGLLRSVEMRNTHARVELLLTSGWCPFAARVLTDVADAINARPASTPARSRWSGTRPGRPTGCRSPPAGKLRFLPDPAAVGDRDAYLAAHHARRPRRTTMIGDAFVFDGVAHPFNFTEKNAFGTPGQMFANHLYAFHAGPDARDTEPTLSAERVPARSGLRRDIRRDGLRRVRHRHARRDAAAADRPVPRRALTVGDVRGTGLPRPGPHRLLGLGQPARGPQGDSTSWSVRSASSAPRRSSSTTSATTTARRSRGGWTTRRSPSPIFEKAQELGVNLIGVHKGVPLGPQPIEHTQTWDMDGAAANFPDINFVIFHVGLPFIDETCWQLIRLPEPVRLDRRDDQLHRPGAADVRRDPRQAAVLVRGGQDRLRLGGADLASAVGAAGVHGLLDPAGPVRRLRLPAADRRQAKRKILGENLLRLHGMDVEQTKARLGRPQSH